MKKKIMGELPLILVAESVRKINKADPTAIQYTSPAPFSLTQIPLTVAFQMLRDLEGR